MLVFGMNLSRGRVSKFCYNTPLALCLCVLRNVHCGHLFRHKITVDERTGRCTLLISKARPEDQGDYMCTASNPAGQDATTATILPGGKEEKQFCL
jgi:hypothetical protein